MIRVQSSIVDRLVDTHSLRVTSTSTGDEVTFRGVTLCALGASS